MAVLSDSEIRKVATEWMNRTSSDHEVVPLLKAQVVATIVAVDGWANDNAASFNSALPAAARTNLTTKQKAELLKLVVSARHRVEEE